MAVTGHIAAAQYPERELSEDRAFVTDWAAVVLDGASAFVPVDVPTGVYVDTLGQHILDALQSDLTQDLADVVAAAIEATAGALDLKPGNSPSSTVSIARMRPDNVDLFVLGDSAIYYGNSESATQLLDERLSTLGIPEHASYRRRLAEGHGYDDGHRELLRRLQGQQRVSIQG